MQSSGRSIRENYSTIWEASRRVVTSHGIAALGMGRERLDSQVFDRVIATDASEAQIANALSYERVEYHVASAEKSGTESESIDLIMVAQAFTGSI